MGNIEQATENGERGTGNEERGTGNGERRERGAGSEFQLSNFKTDDYNVATTTT